jgi:hypothetical protein
MSSSSNSSNNSTPQNSTTTTTRKSKLLVEASTMMMEDDYHPADDDASEMVAAAADQDQLDVTNHGVEVKPTLVRRIILQAAPADKENEDDQTTTTTIQQPKSPLFLRAFQGIFKKKAAKQKAVVSLATTTAKTLSFSENEKQAPNKMDGLKESLALLDITDTPPNDEDELTDSSLALLDAATEDEDYNSDESCIDGESEEYEETANDDDDKEMNSRSLPPGSKDNLLDQIEAEDEETGIEASLEKTNDDERLDDDEEGQSLKSEEKCETHLFPVVPSAEASVGMSNGKFERKKHYGVSKHTRPRKFAQVKGKHTKKQSKAFHKKFFHYAGITMPPDQDSNDQSTKDDWPRFLPVMLYVDEIIDAPTGGGRWPHPSEARAKERVIIGCYDETLVPLIKASLQRACAANWESNEDMDVHFAVTEEDLYQHAFNRTRPNTGN